MYISTILYHPIPRKGHPQGIVYAVGPFSPHRSVIEVCGFLSCSVFIPCGKRPDITEQGAACFFFFLNVGFSKDSELIVQKW